MTKLEQKLIELGYERYNDTYNFGKVKGNSTNTNVITQDANTQDLDRLEKLEKENARLRTKIKKLEKELEKADEYIWYLTQWDYL